MSSVSDGWPELETGEEVLTNGNEVLWRQVHPLRVNGDIVSSEAFEPGSNDNKQLSCSRESIVTAEEAYNHYVEELQLASAGSVAVTVAEAHSERPIVDGNPQVARLRAIDDSATATDEKPLPPGHTYLDFRALGAKRITKKAKQLAFFAKQRGGIKYPPQNAG